MKAYSVYKNEDSSILKYFKGLSLTALFCVCFLGLSTEMSAQSPTLSSMEDGTTVGRIVDVNFIRFNSTLSAEDAGDALMVEHDNLQALTGSTDEPTRLASIYFLRQVIKPIYKGVLSEEAFINGYSSLVNVYAPLNNVQGVDLQKIATDYARVIR